jgi:hypothetical protein
MRIKVLTVFAMLVGLSLASLPGFAHHGSSAYEFAKFPKAYAEPWKMAIDFTLKPDWDFAETFCRPSESVTFKGSGDLTATDPGTKPAK